MTNSWLFVCSFSQYLFVGTGELTLSLDSETAKGMMPSYHIGTLDSASSLKLSEPQPVTTSNEPRLTFLQTPSWTKATLSAKRPISSDTIIFTFALEQPSLTLGLPIGQHLMLRVGDPKEREAIIRSYTPISETSTPGSVDVLIKLYLDTDARKGGAMSKALSDLPVGHIVDFKGPIGKFTYHGRGLYGINGVKKHVERFAMICAGSGVTPVFQVFRAVMRDKGDMTCCTVLDGNRLEGDILCREDLDALLKGNEDRGEVVHTLTQAPEGWKGLRGRISEELVTRYCRVDEGTLVLVCGPEALEKSVHKTLGSQGWRDEQIVFF